MNIKYIFSIIAVVLGIFGFLVDKYKVGDYHTDKYWDCKVIEKYETIRGHKHRAYTEFILVLQLDDKRVFDINVSPSTYTVAKKEEVLVFKLDESDIQFDPNKTKWSNLSFVLYALVFVFLCLVIISWFSEKYG